MKKRILINTHHMPIGGAERALLGLLSVFDHEQYDVDLFVNRHAGALMKFIPPWVNVLPEMKRYSLVLAPVTESLKRFDIPMAYAKAAARIAHHRYRRRHPLQKAQDDFTAFDILWRRAVRLLPDLRDLGHYDAAISFLMPHYVVADKVDAAVKIAWIHTDYSAVAVDADAEAPVWNRFDKIIAISEKTRESFARRFPSLSGRLEVIKNITPVAAVKRLSEEYKPAEYADDVLNILSVGRICPAKNFENIPEIAACLKSKLKFRWYILGPGDPAEIMHRAESTGTKDVVSCIGERDNPYPYIANTDVYVQPSRYEGNCVTVEEAKVLCRPVVVTPYNCAGMQIDHRATGIIAESHSAKDVAAAIECIATDRELRCDIVRNLAGCDYGNEKEIEKLYRLLP